MLVEPGVGSKKILVGTRNPPEPTFWVPTWNPEPTGTRFLGSDSEPGTHWNPLFMVRLGTRNPLEPAFWVPTRNPEPIGTNFGPICLKPGTHWNPLFMVRLGTRNPMEPKYGGFSWVPPGPRNHGTHYFSGTRNHGTHIFQIRVGSTRNPGTHGFLGSAHADPCS